jgi:hypothetical protein
MKVTATTFRLRVDYRIDGKFYNNGSQEDAATDGSEFSSYPFDSKDLEIGESFDVPGELVRVVEYKPTPPDVAVFND